MSAPSKLTTAPTAPVFLEQAKKINEIIDAIAPIINAIGAGSVKITKSGENWIISSSGGGSGGGGGGGGGGLPEDYTFEEFTICNSGAPATRWWPTWLTNPEA